MKSITIIGFGNQAKAWALNLKDSNIKCHIGLRPNSSSATIATKKGFEVFDYTKESRNDYNVILTPDDTHFEIVQQIISLNPKAKFIYAHGYSLTSNKIDKKFPTSHLLLAPKSIASEIRLEYEMNGKIPAVYSLEYSKDVYDEKVLEYIAKGIGITCLRKVNFLNETRADLFSEQTILCSALPYIANFSFETLIKKGISKELAFFECFHELKSISNALVKLGPFEFFKLISPNALLGSEIGKNLLYDEHFKEKIDQVFRLIESGEFEKELKSQDLKLLRKNTLQYWRESELLKVYDELKDELY